jgi:hypothetical protein
MCSYMRHYLLPFFRPRQYRTGLKRVYHGDKNKAMMVHLLYLLALILVPTSFFLPRFVPQTTREAATDSPDVATSTPLVVLFMIGWIPAWHYCEKLGDWIFDRRNPWRVYGGGPSHILRSSPISRNDARHLPCRVTVNWQVLEGGSR